MTTYTLQDSFWRAFGPFPKVGLTNALFRRPVWEPAHGKNSGMDKNDDGRFVLRYDELEDLFKAAIPRMEDPEENAKKWVPIEESKSLSALLTRCRERGLKRLVGRDHQAVEKVLGHLRALPALDFVERCCMDRGGDGIRPCLRKGNTVEELLCRRLFAFRQMVEHFIVLRFLQCCS